MLEFETTMPGSPDGKTCMYCYEELGTENVAVIGGGTPVAHIECVMRWILEHPTKPADALRAQIYLDRYEEWKRSKTSE